MTHIGFAVNAKGTAVSLDFSDAVSEAFDIMHADGLSHEKAAELAVAAEKSGRDPVAFARHFVEVRQGLR